MLFYALFSILVGLYLIINPILTILDNKKYKIKTNILNNIILIIIGIGLLTISIISLCIKIKYEFIYTILMILLTLIALIIMHFSRKSK